MCTYDLNLNRSTGVFFDPRVFILGVFCQFLRFYHQIFSSCSFFVCWNVITWRHDMTSECDVMVWNDIITSETPFSIYWILFSFLRTNLFTKTPKRSQDNSDVMAFPWRRLFHHSTISGSRRDRAKFLFLFLSFSWSRKLMACRPNTWPLRVTLYVKLKWSYKWPILSRPYTC